MRRIAVISTYPPKGSLYNHKGSAVASYTKNTLLYAQKADKELRFTVLADIGEESGSDWYAEEGIEVRPCWKRNDWRVYFDLIRRLRETDRDCFACARNDKNNCHCEEPILQAQGDEAVSDDDEGRLLLRQRRIAMTSGVLFAFEWAMFGSKKWLLVFLPFFLVYLRLSGKKVYFVSHGVLLDATLVAEQMGVKPGSLMAKVWTVGLRFLYWSIVLLSTRVVAFEEYLRQELIKLTHKPDKIVTITHGVHEPEIQPDKQVSRKKMGLPANEFLVMCFGFLVWYKGSDWLVEKVDKYFKTNPKAKWRLLMVGGGTKTYAKDPVYQEYLAKIDKLAAESKGKITITGFVSEEQIADYYAAADLLVLPYRVFVSSSGPLSWAFSFRKAFLLSEKLRDYEMSQDFCEAMQEVGVGIDELVFDLSGEDLTEKIEKLMTDRRQLEKIVKLSLAVYDKRCWQVTGEKYANVMVG